MRAKNSVFIATSLDGYIADKDGSIEWLTSFPNPEGLDMGYGKFMERMDAVVMGRKTFETLMAFNIPWPYTKQVFVLSRTLKDLPPSLNGQMNLMQGDIPNVLHGIHQKGFHRLYIDGGTTIRNFLKLDLIDEMILTTIPDLLGGGTSLFEDLPQAQHFKLETTTVFLE